MRETAIAACDDGLSLVTVITPSFNSPDILDTVRSVLEQDYPRLEYIVIDDGSESFDRKAIEEFYSGTDSRVELRIMVNEKNLGTVRTLNRAIAASSGRYIFNIAADDVYADPSVISEWVAEFESTGAMVITAKRDIYDPGMRVRYRTAPSGKVIRKIRESTPKELFRAMYGSNMVVGCCTAQSRACFDTYGLYDERYRIIEDYPRFLRLSREGVRIHFFDRTVVKYRSGGISSQARYNRVYEEESDSIFRNEVLEFADDKGSAESEYGAWKRRTVLRRDFMISYERAGRLGKLASLIRYGLRDPPMALQFVQERMAIRFRRRQGLMMSHK